MRPRTVILCLAFLALVVSGSGASCARQHEEPYPMPGPVYVTPFKAPPEYERWYHQAEACAGLKGKFEGINWGVVPGPWGDPKQPTYAYWLPTYDSAGFVKRIDIVINAISWRDSVTVMHEALHDILFRNGWQAPSLPAYAGKQDSLVNLHPSPPYTKCAPPFYPLPSVAKP